MSTPKAVPVRIKINPTRRVKELSSLRSVFFIFVLPLMSCGVAHVQYGPVKKPPTRFNYIGYHTIPRAYGGGVCTFVPKHSHAYPPVPAKAFVETDEGYRDTRAFDAYTDPHPHSPQTCFRKGWHLHLRPRQ